MRSGENTHVIDLPTLTTSGKPSTISIIASHVVIEMMTPVELFILSSRYIFHFVSAA